MPNYGQYCPVAQSLDILGDRWTLLIVRDLLTGVTRFNHLERGLPGISRALLAQRLRQLQAAGIVEKRELPPGSRNTEYRLTRAGQELHGVIEALLIWGTRWAFGDPSPEQLDPLLLMWWMHRSVNQAVLPGHRVVVQFDFHSDKNYTYWLLLSRDDVSLCLTHPGFEVDVLVTSELATFYKLWLGRIDYWEALQRHGVTVEGVTELVDAFPRWFNRSLAAPAVRAARVAQHR